MKKKTIEKRKLHKDCWNLNDAFLSWLWERLPVYLRDADGVINLDAHQFYYHDKMYTHKELIQLMIRDLCIIHGQGSDNLWESDDEKYSLTEEVLEIWKLVFFSMWW